MEPTTPVIFRKYPGPEGEVIALFPTVRADNLGHCGCFVHVGQHVAADYVRVIQDTRPATPEEYADPKAELERVHHYRLRPVLRRPRRREERP